MDDNSPRDTDAAVPPPVRDLPFWAYGLLPALTWIVLTPFALLSLPLLQVIFQGDEGGGGVVENGTVLVLIPGIIAGAATFLSALRRQDLDWGRYWFLLWTLALIYFAGEEISWGQHYFHWSTPELLHAINDQQETNLHNMSSWLDQKPRALVETFILVGGLLIPIALAFRKFRFDPASHGFWFWPTLVCAPAAATVLLTRILKILRDSFPGDLTHYLGSDELREFGVALFLTVYLLSAWYRLKHRPAPLS